MPRLARPMSPAAIAIFKAACLSNQPAWKTAEAIAANTGERFSARTIGRRMTAWRKRRNRVAVLTDISTALKALGANRQLIDSITSDLRVDRGQHRARAGAVMQTARAFLDCPSSSRFNEVLLSLIGYQTEVAVLHGKGGGHA